MSAMRWAAAFLAAAWMSVACAGETFDAGVLRVERHGERGVPVILIPGLASGPWVWQGTVEALAGEHDLYAVALPGFDGRPAATGDLLQQTAAALRTLIVTRRLDRPVLIGHSLGGVLALEVAAAHPDLVGGVVTVDGLPVFPGTENMSSSQRASLGERMRAQIARATPDEFAAQQLDYMRKVGVLREADAARIAALTSRSDPRAVGDYVAAVMALDLRAGLPSIRAPVLAIAPYAAAGAPPGLTEASKRAYYEALLRGVPALEVVTIAPARHFVMLDQPQAFTAAVRRFLEAQARSH